MTGIPAEVERLHSLGFAVHWLRPKSKIPVEARWTQGPRLSLEALRKTFKPTYGFGVRLGHASQIGDNYLAVLDLDIKSTEPRHRKEAEAALFEAFPQCQGSPHVLSGRGNGSAHYYVLVPEPQSKDETKGRSDERVKVHMPSVKPSRSEEQNLSLEELDAGTRLRAAWEISLLSDGRQAALAGTIHPDTKKRYVWGRELKDASELPLLGARRAGATKKALAGPKPAPRTYALTDVDAKTLGLKKDQLAALVKGDGVTDRSATAFALSMAMVQRKVPRNDILSVLTRRDYYLGNVGFDHAQTDNRQRAARWIDKYCLVKAEERINQTDFDVEEIDETKKPKAKKDDDASAREPYAIPQGLSGTIGGWEDQLELYQVGKDGPLKVRASYLNIRLILANLSKRPDFLHRNLFNLKDFYTCKTPWGNRKGDERSGNSDDAINIKKWLSDKYGMEPAVTKIDEVLSTISLEYKSHPVKDYLRSLQWDGIERVDAAFKLYLGAVMPEPYLSEVTRKFFAACVSRIFEPGCKFDYVVVLEGLQGLGKSTFCRDLVGHEWFLEGLPNLHDKDAALNLQGAWICELGELAALNRSSNDVAKSFISRSWDQVRPPYGRARQTYKRSTVFIGTTDKNDYLTDSAGNRRYWPVHVKQCNFETLIRDRDQLWAEAMFNYSFDAEPLYLTGAASEQAKAIQESRRIEDEGDSMAERLSDWIKDQIKEQREFRKIRMADLFNSGPFIIFPRSIGNTMRAGEILRRAGYRKKHTESGSLWVVDSN